MSGVIQIIRASLPEALGALLAAAILAGVAFLFKQLKSNGKLDLRSVRDWAFENKTLVLVSALAVALFGLAFWTLNSRIQGLKSITAKQDAEIASAYVTQTAQAASLVALEGTRVVQDAELSSVQATLTLQPLSQSQICDQVSITAIPEQVTFEKTEDDSVQADVDYELLAPPTTGVTVILHVAEIFVQIDSELIRLVSGTHIGHFDEHAAAGQSIRVDDLVWLGRDQLDKAIELNSTLLLERKTFYLTSDEGFYCKKPVDVRVEITERE
jgi:Tfp pilus assembly protein PilO